jgi:hypothetical protein
VKPHKKGLFFPAFFLYGERVMGHVLAGEKIGTGTIDDGNDKCQAGISF